MRGPSSGGSGQDNIYLFDGVNVTRPLFGSLSAEPSSHDIEQVTTIKGGARAINFDRSGGFTIDTVSKSGSSRLVGELSYKFQNAGMSAALKSGQISQFEQSKTWITAGVWWPVASEQGVFLWVLLPARDHAREPGQFLWPVAAVRARAGTGISASSH